MQELGNKQATIASPNLSEAQHLKFKEDFIVRKN
jgi:hypothetical protein